MQDDAFLAIEQSLQALPQSHQYLLALSGGLDSMALLHAMLRYRPDLKCLLETIHIDHGLQPDSASWGRKCQSLCNELKVSLSLQTVTIEGNGQGVEGEAREKRYAVFAQLLQPGGVLLTAHHANDQAETVLHHLIRGSGSAGLAAMPFSKNIAAGQHVRPLLSIKRSLLAQYAREHTLDYIEDPSNEDIRYRRNFIRQEILPRIQQTWPDAIAGINRAATIQANQLELTNDIAVEDLGEVTLAGGTLDLQRMADYSHSRQINLLRYWLRHFGFEDTNLHTAQLDQLLKQVIHAAPGASPELIIKGTVICRSYNQLHQMPIQHKVDLDKSAIDKATQWHLDTTLSLASIGLYLEPHTVMNATNLRRADCVEVRFREGGEQIQLSKDGHQTSLKNLFQARQVPVWLRDTVPLIYHNERLIIVWGYAIAADC